MECVQGCHDTSPVHVDLPTHAQNQNNTAGWLQPRSGLTARFTLSACAIVWYLRNGAELVFLEYALRSYIVIDCVTAGTGAGACLGSATPAECVRSGAMLDAALDAGLPLGCNAEPMLPAEMPISAGMKPPLGGDSPVNAPTRYRADVV